VRHVKIWVKFVGFPDLRHVIGGKEISVALEQGLFGELIRHLDITYGASIRKGLLDENGHVDQSVQVLINEQDWISREDASFRLNDGDRVTFLLMVAGG
jgi:hypothetical protein